MIKSHNLVSWIPPPPTHQIQSEPLPLSCRWSLTCLCRWCEKLKACRGKSETAGSPSLCVTLEPGPPPSKSRSYRRSPTLQGEDTVGQEIRGQRQKRTDWHILITSSSHLPLSWTLENKTDFIWLWNRATLTLIKSEKKIKLYLETIPPLGQIPVRYAVPSASQERVAPHGPSPGWPRCCREIQVGVLQSSRWGAGSPSGRTGWSSDASRAPSPQWTRSCWTPPGPCDRWLLTLSRVHPLWSACLRRTLLSPSEPHLWWTKGPSCPVRQ